VTDHAVSNSDSFAGAESAADGPELHEAEIRARRALGLGEGGAPSHRGADSNGRPAATDRASGDRSMADRSTGDRSMGDRFTGDRQRRRFVHDGDVPVVMVANLRPAATAAGTPGVNRLAVAEQALDAERHARQRAERALAEANAQLRDLQTKIGHANLARDEAVDTASRLRADLQRLEELLDSERQARAAEQQARAEADQALQAARESRERAAARHPAPADASPTPHLAPKRSVGRPARGRPPKTRAADPKPVKWW
jgi:hypothetical protein